MRIELSRQVAAPVEHVFGVFSDFRGADQRLSGIVSLKVEGDEPIGVGTAFDETRVMFGREHTERMHISAFEPGRSYTVSGESCGARFDTTFTFEPDGDGTRVSMAFRSTPLNMIAWMMSPLAVLTGGAVKDAMQKDIDELAAVCESSGG